MFSFDPIFVLPSIASSVNTPPTVIPLSLARVLLCTGFTPSSPPTSSTRETFEEVQRKAKEQGRVLCLLPEGTTSNARGILKFEDVFTDRKGWAPFGVWLVCVK